MKITEYQRTSQGWQELRSYYWFAGDRNIEPWTRQVRHPCPGCGRAMTSLAQTDHVCLGGTESWPRLPQARRPGTGGRPRTTPGSD